MTIILYPTKRIVFMEPDPRIKRIQDIKYMLNDEPITAETAIQLLDELETLEMDLNIQPPATGSAEWFARIPEIQY